LSAVRGLGPAVPSPLLRRTRRPAFAFFVLQACVGLYVGFSIYGLSSLLASSGSTLSAYFSGYEPIDAAAAFSRLWVGGTSDPAGWQFVRLYLLLPAALVGPPTIAMGATFPVLQKVVQVDLKHLGRRIGLVLIANIAGSAAGSILTGWIALSWIGTATLLRALTATSALFIVLAIPIAVRTFQRPIRWACAAAALAVVALAAFRVPDGRTL